jgi:RNA polymerase sigma-70 factor (family 1)
MSFINGQGRSLLSFSKGNSNAFSKVFDRYYPALCYFAYRLISDKEEAQDIVQNTFLKFWEKTEFEDERPIRTWLYVTTRNSCLNYLRVMGRQQNALAEMSQEDKDDFVLNQMVRAEVLRELTNAINTLPPKCRQIFQLHLGRYTNEEIAVKLGLSVHTVKNQLQRGKELMRNRINTAALLALLTFFPNFFD